MPGLFSRQFLAHSLFVTSLLFTSNQAFATQNDEQHHWYQFTFENDVLGLTNTSDDGYSNGIAYAWGSSSYDSFDSLNIPNWIRAISDWTFINQGDSQQYSISYGLSQSMYTPNDISEPELIENDRPYAGTMLWHSKIRHFANNRANSLGLILGVAGPASLAEQSQTIVHEMIGARTPEGWDNQISNELVFRVEAEHIERFYDHSFTDSTSIDVSSYSEAGFGNLRSDIGTGLTFRVGNLLDETYAAINPFNSQAVSVLTRKTTNQFYWQLFTSVYAGYVFNDITLDGNTFTNSHSVEMIHDQALISAGMFVMYQHWAATFSTHRATKQFDGQINDSKYGSITVSYYY